MDFYKELLFYILKLRHCNSRSVELHRKTNRVLFQLKVKHSWKRIACKLLLQKCQHLVFEEEIMVYKNIQLLKQLVLFQRNLKNGNRYKHSQDLGLSYDNACRYLHLDFIKSPPDTRTKASWPFTMLYICRGTSKVFRFGVRRILKYLKRAQSVLSTFISEGVLLLLKRQQGLITVNSVRNARLVTDFYFAYNWNSWLVQYVVSIRWCHLLHKTSVYGP